jgi:hypothetical protein
LKYKDTGIYSKLERNVDYNTDDPRLLLEYFLSGYFSESFQQEFKDFLSCCLQIDPDKRKDSCYLLTHDLFKGIEIDTKDKFYLIPVEKEIIQSIISKEEISKQHLANGFDNYEIFKNILKIDMIVFLKKKGILDYKPKVLDIPNYFSLYSSEVDDYSLNEDENIQTKTIKNFNNNELFYDKELNEKRFNEGCLIFIGNYIINLPIDYEKDTVLLNSFIKSSVYDLQLFKSEGLKSDKSSTSSKVSHLESAKIDKKYLNQNIEKEISYYFKLKLLLYNFIFGYSKKDEIISEIRRTSYHIPENLRSLVYLVLLDIDYLNDIEEMELGTYYENRKHIQSEMNQIKKDILRCEEYDVMFKSEDGKQHINMLFESLLYNKEDFFYNQGMDSIAAAVIKLYYLRLEYAYQVFYKLIKKLLYIFFDIQSKSIKSLNFHHLIISRLLAFIEPELYLYLKGIDFFDDQFASNWILTLFSSKSHLFRNI